MLKKGLYILLLLLLAGCSTKKNTFFNRQYHQVTTRYNVYFNGKEALKAGGKKMETGHKEDYTNLLPVFVSNNEQTRMIASADADYAIEKAVKAIDKHSITAKPKRRKNKESKTYEAFRKKKEFNNQMDKCYLLLGKGYFYKKKYPMANNTFRFIQRQYTDDEKVMAQTRLWLFRSYVEMGRYDEAARLMNELSGVKFNKKDREMLQATRTDLYVRQGLYREAIGECETLVANCRNMRNRSRYNFLLSQLYLKDNQNGPAMYALKKVVRFNFNYEMAFNARINMALAYQDGDNSVYKKLKKMLRNSNNIEFQDRIYYAMANIEQKRGNEKEAVDLYWKSVNSSVNNDNQKSLSFLKLGDHYFKGREYVNAHTCYDSCMFLMDSRVDNYDKLKGLVTDLSALVSNLNVIQKQDSLLRLAALPESERNRMIDGIIQKIKDEEIQAKEQEKQAQQERNFYQRNDMISRGDAFSQQRNSSSNSNSGDWYFYNPVTISLGRNDFKRKWGRRKLEDNWRRQNKSMVDFGNEDDKLAEVTDEKQVTDVKSRDYYLQDVPLTDETKMAAHKSVEDAYYRAGEIYMYKFKDYEKALECFEALMSRYTESNYLPMVYYLSYDAAQKAGNPSKAEKYKSELIARFPESDFAKGLLDPNYFRKIERDLQMAESRYAEAFKMYNDFYYAEASSACRDILKQFPDTKLKANVLFLETMCQANLNNNTNLRAGLDDVLASQPDKELKELVTRILAGLDTGEKPVNYAGSDLAEARYRKQNRNWRFSDNLDDPQEEELKKVPFKAEKEKEHLVVLAVPEDMKHMTQVQLRLSFLNAAEAFEGNKHEVVKENLWYNHPAFFVKTFPNYEKATGFMAKVSTDRVLLKNLAEKPYRVFAITADNLTSLKRLKNVDTYVDFFVKEYFDNQNEGEIMTGKRGAAAHIFKFEESEKHDFVLLLPYAKVNLRKVAEALMSIERAFAIEKQDYDDEHEMIVVKAIGSAAHAMEYMNTVMKDKEVFDRLAGNDYQAFVISQNNLKALVETQNLVEYEKFFNDNYLKYITKEVVNNGVEDGDFIFNKSLPHKFVLFYSNEVDPKKILEAFQEYNFAGIKANNLKYNDENDCMVISGFNNREEAMRYFNTVLNSRKVFKPLKNTDYRNFIISEGNFEVLIQKQLIESYLLFFKKYYLN